MSQEQILHQKANESEFYFGLEETVGLFSVIETRTHLLDACRLSTVRNGNYSGHSAETNLSTHRRRNDTFPPDGSWATLVETYVGHLVYTTLLRFQEV